MRIFCLFLVCLFIVSSANGDGGSVARVSDDLAQRVRGSIIQMLRELKESEDPSKVVDYIDWKGAYDWLSDFSKDRISVSSWEDLREYYRALLKDPRKFAIEEVESNSDDMPYERYKEELERARGTGVKFASLLLLNLSRRLKDTEFKVGDVTFKSVNVAVVELYRLEGRKVFRFELPLVKRNGAWRISLLEIGAGH